ncbi:MAG: hypothetical protein HW407_1065 [Bacteroidetes bacterium]|nr:hypothetical protein [Bacteroidota bacterium]
MRVLSSAETAVWASRIEQIVDAVDVQKRMTFMADELQTIDRIVRG